MPFFQSLLQADEKRARIAYIIIEVLQLKRVYINSSLFPIPNACLGNLQTRLNSNEDDKNIPILYGWFYRSPSLINSSKTLTSRRQGEYVTRIELQGITRTILVVTLFW